MGAKETCTEDRLLSVRIKIAYHKINGLGKVNPQQFNKIRMNYSAYRETLN